MSANPVRSRAAQSIKDELLEQQGYVCIYCAEPFGSVVRKRNGGYTVTSVHFDHAIPLAYLNANPRWNWVAACNICNMIKGSKMFHTIAEIRMHILGIRDARNQNVAWLAPVSCEEDPEKWAAAFSSYLAGFGVFEREIEDVPFDINPPKPKKPRAGQKRVKGPWPWSK